MSTILSYNPIAYWPLTELSGTTAINYGSLGVAANGVYSGPSLAQTASPCGGLAPLFSNALDFVNVYSVALNGGFNGSLFTILLFSKVFNVGVWTDATARILYRIAVDDANNYSRIARSTTNNRVASYYGGGGTTEFVAADGQTSIDWQMHTLTVTRTGDQLKYYINTSQIGSTQTGIGLWAGDLSSTRCVIGNISTAGGQNYHGYISNVAIFSGVLTLEQLGIIYASRCI